MKSIFQIALDGVVLLLQFFSLCNHLVSLIAIVRSLNITGYSTLRVTTVNTCIITSIKLHHLVVNCSGVISLGKKVP